MAWIEFTHNLGGDSICVETSNWAKAEAALLKVLDIDYETAFVDDGCEHQCGPAWSERNWKGPDATLTKPEDLGERWDGSPRTTYIYAEELKTLL